MISEGYTNFQNATCEGRGFKSHELLKGHKEAVWTHSRSPNAHRIFRWNIVEETFGGKIC